MVKCLWICGLCLALVLAAAGCRNPAATSREENGAESSRSSAGSDSRLEDDSDMSMSGTRPEPEKNPSIEEIVGRFGLPQSDESIRMNGYVVYYKTVLEYVEPSPLKKIDDTHSYATIQPKEGGTYYFHFKTSDESDTLYFTHGFYKRDIVKKSKLLKIKKGDTLADVMAVDPNLYLSVDRHILCNLLLPYTVHWTDDGLYQIEYEIEPEIEYEALEDMIVKAVSKVKDNRVRAMGSEFVFAFDG